jgi:HEAT repeat protein
LLKTLLVCGLVVSGSALALGKTAKTRKPQVTKPQVLKTEEIAKVELVREYRLGDVPVSAESEKVIAVVETIKNIDPKRFAGLRLADCRMQYSLAGKKEESVGAVAIGMQMKLASGGLAQLWIIPKPGADSQVQTETSIDGTAVDGTVLTKLVSEAQSISGLTVLAGLPKGVVRFKLILRNLDVESQELVVASGAAEGAQASAPVGADSGKGNTQASASGPAGSQWPIAALVRSRAIVVQGDGIDISELRVHIRNQATEALVVLIPAGTLFVARDPKTQNMVVSRLATVLVAPGATANATLKVASANRTRSIPREGDLFDLVLAGPSQELARLMLSPQLGQLESLQVQAAVWIVTDNATYSELGILRNSQSMASAIGAFNATAGLRACQRAGIDIASRRIWDDRGALIAELEDDEQRVYWPTEVRQKAAVLREWLAAGYGGQIKADLANASLPRRVNAARAVGRYRLPAGAQLLLPLLKDSDRQVRMAAAASLGKLADVSSAAALIRYLETFGRKDREECRSAAVALGEIKEVSSFEVLTRALDWDCSSGAVVALGQLGDPRAVPLLLGVARPDTGHRPDPHGERARHARVALARFGAVEEVLGLINTESLTTTDVEVLALLKDDRALALLLKALVSSEGGHQGGYLKSYAAEALGKTARVEAVGPLIDVLQDPSSDSSSSYRFNKTIAGYAAASLEELTGQKFGKDGAQWQAWWKANHPAKKDESPKARRRR